MMKYRTKKLFQYSGITFLIETFFTAPLAYLHGAVTKNIKNHPINKKAKIMTHFQYNAKHTTAVMIKYEATIVARI